jgi:hypothetical protein
LPSAIALILRNPGNRFIAFIFKKLDVLLLILCFSLINLLTAEKNDKPLSTQFPFSSSPSMTKSAYPIAICQKKNSIGGPSHRKPGGPYFVFIVSDN